MDGELEQEDQVESGQGKAIWEGRAKVKGYLSGSMEINTVETC